MLLSSQVHIAYYILDKWFVQIYFDNEWNIDTSSANMKNFYVLNSHLLIILYYLVACLNILGEVG